MLTAANIKMVVFWDIAPCNRVEILPHFGRSYCLYRLDYECVNFIAFPLHSTLTNLTLVCFLAPFLCGNFLATRRPLVSEVMSGINDKMTKTIIHAESTNFGWRELYINYYGQ